MRRLAPLLFVAGLVVVLLQIITCIGIFLGAAMIRGCDTNDTCDMSKGLFCQYKTERTTSVASEMGDEAERGACRFCGGGATYMPPLPLQETADGETLNWAYAADYAGFNATLVAEVCQSPDRSRTETNWCDACVGAVTGTVDDFVQCDLWTQNIRAMSLQDWMALLLCMLLIALSCMSEIKDVRLCKICLDRADPGKMWRFAFNFLSFLRVWILLPCLIMAICNAVMMRGADAMSIALNSVGMCAIRAFMLFAFARS